MVPLDTQHTDIRKLHFVEVFVRAAMSISWMAQWLGGYVVGWCLLASVAVAIQVVTDEKRIQLIAENQVLAHTL